MKKILLSLAFLPMLACTTSTTSTPAPTPERPPIIGVAHAALYCSDIDATCDFLKECFGFDESIRYYNPDGSPRLSAIKINERQIIELFPEKEAGSDRLIHYAVETTDAEGMRQYLKAKGYEVPDSVKKLNMGLINFFMTDPTGHLLEFVEYTNDGDLGNTHGKHMPTTRVSNRMNHLGFYVPDKATAEDFFCNVLGFKTDWDLEVVPDKLSIMLLRVPEGEDLIEILLSPTTPTQEELLFGNHISLEVIDAEEAVAKLKTRPIKDKTAKIGEAALNVLGVHSSNCVLPDGNRIEIME